MKHYLYQGRVAKVDDSAVESFLQQFPGAEEAVKLQANGRTATVALSKVDQFKAQYPDAIPLTQRPANAPVRGTPDPQTAPVSNQDFIRNFTQKPDNIVNDVMSTKAPADRATLAPQGGDRQVNYQREQASRMRQAEVENNAQNTQQEYQANDNRLLEMSRAGETESEEYGKLLRRQGEIETKFPAIAAGMDMDEYIAYEMGKEIVKENPLASYLQSAFTGSLSLLASPYTVFNPGSKLTDYLSYQNAGMAEAGTTLGNMFRSTLYSIPMTLAIAASPVAGTALSSTMFTSQNIKTYYDAGTLDTGAVIASVLSGITQAAIEMLSSTSQFATYRRMATSLGKAGLEEVIKADLRAMFKPNIKSFTSGLFKAAHTEGMEEVLQSLSDIAIRRVINGDEVPDIGQLTQQIFMDYAGGAFGGFLMAGVGSGYNIAVNKRAMQALELSAQNSDAGKMLMQAVQNIQSGNMENAEASYNQYVVKNASDNIRDRRVMGIAGLVIDSINTWKAKESITIINDLKDMKYNLENLRREERDLIKQGAVPGMENQLNEELYYTQEQIKSLERRISKREKSIELDDTLREFYDLGIKIAKKEAKTKSRPEGLVSQQDAAMNKAVALAKDIVPDASPSQQNAQYPMTSAAKTDLSVKPEAVTDARAIEPSLSPEDIAQQKKDGTYIKSAQERAASTEKIELGESKGMSVGNPNETMNRTDPDTDKPEGVHTGKEVSVAVPNSKRVKVRYILVDRKSLITSNNNDFQENPEFPVDLQNRNRDNAASRAQVMKIEAELDPYIVMDNPIAKDGAPIVIRNNDGRWFVLSGNGRMMGINRRADIRGAEAMQEYEEAVKERLEEFGFDPKTDTTGKVLVRAYYGENDIIQMAQQLNTETAAKLSRVEMATSDATAIANLIRKGDNILGLLKVRSGDVLSASNADFLQEFLTKIIRTGGGDYQTSDGGWSDTMRTRVEMALISYVFNGDARAEKMLEGYYEAKDSKTKRLFKGIIDTIGEILKLRMLIEKHGLLDLDISQTVLDTILDIERLRQQGISLENALYETDLFSENRQAIPDSKRPLYIAMYNIKSQKAARDFFGSYYENAWDAISPEEYTLLSGTAESKEQFLDDYLKEWNDEQAKKGNEPGAEEADAQDNQKVDGQASVSDTETSNTGEQRVDSKPRNKPETIGKVLTRVDDRVAEDALIGMLPRLWTHDSQGKQTYTIEHQGRTMTIRFANGTEIVLNRLTGDIQVGNSKAIGRTRLETSKEGNLQVVIDLVDGRNSGNYTLFHEAFHTAWKLWLSAEQRQYLNGYFKRQFLAGKVKPNGISSREWNVMKPADRVATAKSLWGEWDQSMQAEMLEEFAANHCEAWIGRRAEAVTLIEKMWQKLLDRIRHFAVTIGIAPKGTTVKDIFWQTETGRLEGRGEAFEGKQREGKQREGKQRDRNKLIPEESYLSEENIINPIDTKASNTKKLKQMAALRAESKAIFEALLARVDSALQVSSGTPENRDKKDSTSIKKTKRPDVREKKPWFGIEHIRDYYRGKTILTDPRQLVDIANMIEEANIGVVKIDYAKLFRPKEWGFRIAAFDLRMPNGLIVEYYLPVEEIEAVKKEAHDIYDKWRDLSPKEIRESGRWQEYMEDKQRSNALYSNAWRSALRRLGITQEDVKRSLTKAFASDKSSTTEKSLNESAGEGKSSATQLPSVPLKKGIDLVASSTRPSSATDISTSSKVISTSTNKINQSSENATKSQDKSTRYKQLQQAEIQEAEQQMADIRAKYEGTEQWMKAPNGKPTKLNEQQWLQVRTENFKKWFGDWENDPKNASKVVDENGEPMVVYHGGTVENEFSFEFMGRHGTSEGYGFYFAKNKKQALGYEETTKGRLVEAFLNIRKFASNDAITITRAQYKKVLKGLLSIDKESLANYGYDIYTDGEYRVIESAMTEYDSSESDTSVIAGLANSGAGTTGDVIDLFRKISGVQGVSTYSGTSAQAGVNEIYVVFSPNDIKSATANVGTFDAENADIRYKMQQNMEEGEAERQMEEVRSKYEGTDQWLKAPNGKPTNLNERQWLQVRTPNFKKWFGDWENDPENASKVVDKNGEPMVVYHGSRSYREFYVFRSNSPEEETYFTSKKEGTYRYTRRPEMAHKYRDKLGRKVFPIMLSLAQKYITKETRKQWIQSDYFHEDEYYVITNPSNYYRENVNNGDMWGYQPLLVDAKYWIKWADIISDEMDDANEQVPEADRQSIELIKKYANDLILDPEGTDTPLIYPVFLNIRSPLVLSDVYYISGHQDNLTWIHKAKKNQNDGIINPNTYDLDARDVFITFSPSQIKSATANVGTFGAENADIRYKMLDDDYVIARLEAARKMIAQFNADPEKISDEIAETKGLDPEQVKEKLGRQIKAAYRETSEQWQTLLAASRVAGVDEFVAQNKPETTDRSDLTFHLSEAEQIAMYEEHIGLSIDEAMKAGEDRYSFYLGGLRIFARGNALMQEWMETKEKIAALAESGKTDALLDQHLAHLTSMIQDSSSAYSNLKGQAGRILRHAREQKTQMLANYNRMIQTMEADSAEIYKRIAEEQAEIAELEALVVELDKEIEVLEKMVKTAVVQGAQALKHAVDSALKQDRYSSITAAEELEALKQRREALKSHLNTRIAHVKSLQEQVTATADQISELSKQLYYLKPGKKPSIKDVKPRKMYRTEWIRTFWYNNILSGPGTHIINISSNIFNAALEQALVNTILDPKAGIQGMGASLGSFFKALGFSHGKYEEAGFYQALINPTDYAKKWEMGQIQSFMSRPGKDGKPKKDFPLLRLANMNLTIMAAEDQFFKYGNMKSQLTSLAVAESRRTGRTVKDLLQYPTEDMIIQAGYEASRMSFNHNPEGVAGAIVNMVDTFYKDLDKYGLFGRLTALGFRHTVMPFTRIVGNVLNATIDWTPLGLIRAMQYARKNPNSLVNKQMNLWKNKDGSMRVSPYASRNVARQITRATLGTLLMSILLAMTKPWEEGEDKMGIISGDGPEDYEKRKQLMALGWTPYSIKIGNRWMSYVETPMQGPLSIVGNLHDYFAFNQSIRPKDIWTLTGFSMMGMADSFFQRSFLSSLRGTIMAIQRKDERWLNRQIASAVSMPFPSSNNLLRFIDNQFNNDVHAPATLTQFIKLSIPFMSKQDIAKAVNVYGNGEVRRSTFARLVGVPAKANETLVIVDRFGKRKDMSAVTQTILNAGLKIPVTRAYEIKLGDDRYVWIEGSNKQRFQELRGLEVAMHIYEKQELINKLAETGKIDDLADLLRNIGTKATREAKRQLLSERRSQLERQTIYSKSRDIGD